MSQSALFGGLDIFKAGAQEEKGERAHLSNLVAGVALSDLMKTTLGPKGMDKILQSLGDAQTGRSSQISITNDGATILKNIWMENPAGKILIDVSKTQDDEVGDGTTSVCVLSGELLREAEQLLQLNIHPQTIISGWRAAHHVAITALEAAARDNGGDAGLFREDLLNIARTTLSSKVLSFDMEHFAHMAVDAVLRLRGSTNLESINIIKKLGGTLSDSFLAEGFILEKKIGIGQPKRIENAKILVANTPMDTDKIKIFGARARVESMAKLAALETAEKQKMKEKVNKIVHHGINCFINRQLIYNYPEELFGQAGVMAIEHADFDGIERLALALGAEIASTFDNPELVKVGECALIDEIMVGEDTLIRFSGCKGGEACTVILRGSSQHILDEAERSLHDALCVLSQTVKETRTVLGAGCSEMLMAKAVDEEAKRTAGKKSMAMESYAKALRKLPAIIAENAGLDSADIVSQLQSAHYQGQTTAGLDLKTGTVADVAALRITESFKCKSCVVNNATEAAEMILRVDDVIKCAPRERARR